MVLVNSICFEQEFIGAGNVTGSPSNMFRRSCQSMLPRLFPGSFHLTSFRKITFEFFTPIQPNIELAGFKKTFGKILQTGFNKNVLPQSAGPYKRSFASFLRPRIRRFLSLKHNFHTLCCFEPTLLSHYLATFPPRYIDR